MNSRVEDSELDINPFNQYKTKLIIWEVVGFVVIAGIGALNHYMFEWLNSWKPIGWLFPINEATWEHTKMLFWPGLAFFIAEFFFLGKHFKKYIVGKSIGLYAGVLAMLSFWYTVRGAIVGPDTGMWFGIVSYIFAAIVQQGTSFVIFTFKYDMDKEKQKILDIISLVAVGILLVAMIIFTYIQPALPTFFDTENGIYGFIP